MAVLLVSCVSPLSCMSFSGDNRLSEGLFLLPLCEFNGVEMPNPETWTIENVNSPQERRMP